MFARLRPVLSLALLTSVLASSVALAQTLPDGAAGERPAARATTDSVTSASLSAPDDDPTAGQFLRVNGPEYGMNIFIWGSPETTERDLAKVTDAKFGWQKSLFQWRGIERSRGNFDWWESDRIVQASNAAGVKIIARVDFQPAWARFDAPVNGPPDNFEDFDNFISALADRYRAGSPYGTIHAIEMWNEPNIHINWGGQPIGPASAATYVRLLCGGFKAAKRTAPEIVVISGALTPTGTLNRDAADDVVYTQWMYDAGVKGCFDVLGAHGAGYKAPPWVGPAELATNPKWGGDQSFGFRRTEQLREVMVRNGDGGKQIWLTEFGWTSDTVNPGYAWHRVSEDEKADYVVEAYRWAFQHWKPWIGVMVLWNIAAPDWTERREEYWWSVTYADGSTRPAYDAVAAARASGYLPDPN